MDQVWMSGAGTPEVFRGQAPDPRGDRGRVRTRVKAAGIKLVDLMARVGLYPDRPRIPGVVGYEVSRVVEQVGEGATGLAGGDRITKLGGNTEVIALVEEQVFKLPRAMTFEDAAAPPVVYLTAYDMMLFVGNLRPGSTILIHSAAGGVGIAAIQLAKMHGCSILGTARKSKHAYLRAQGCTHPIDSEGDYAAAARTIVGDRGIDLILDPVGGKSWTEGYELLAPSGRLVASGFSAAAYGRSRNLLHTAAQLFKVKNWSPVRFMEDTETVAGTNIGHLSRRLDLLRPQAEELLRLYARSGRRDCRASLMRSTS
jgi:synaptic vesicle membrane protein VAT-1